MNTSINEDTKICSKCNGSGTLQLESYVKIIDKQIFKLEVCDKCKGTGCINDEVRK